jgi:mono/diheme cytochrome c family protein
MSKHDQRSPPRRTRLSVATLVAGALAVVGCSVMQPGQRADGTRAERLYREHCAACHGAAGDGRGSAAVGLDVRPRDFVDEEFRYVSAIGGPPTTDDLLKTIRDGRRLGQMPAFPYLDRADARLLAEYVRGVRRGGVASVLTMEFGDDDDMTPEEIDEIAAERVAAGEPVSMHGPGPGFRPDTERGRTLYMENCASCHGPSGRGDGLSLPKDDLGNPIEVRDITSGLFRGGTTPAEVFRRIRCGVPGTPMPATEDLKDEEVWQLVNFTEFLAAGR